MTPPKKFEYPSGSIAEYIGQKALVTVSKDGKRRTCRILYRYRIAGKETILTAENLQKDILFGKIVEQ